MALWTIQFCLNVGGVGGRDRENAPAKATNCDQF